MRVVLRYFFRFSGAVLCLGASLIWCMDLLPAVTSQTMGRYVALVAPTLDLAALNRNEAALFWTVVTGLALFLFAGFIRTPIEQEFIAAGAGKSKRSELRQILARFKLALLSIGIFSALINVFMLTGALYMLEIYDRVLPSRSIPTLVGLSIIAAILFIGLGALEYIRGRMLMHIGMAIDEALAERLFKATIRLPLFLGPKGEAQSPIKDLDSIRSMLAGNGPGALFDLPWIPFYLVIIYAFHPILGLVALCGAIVLVLLTLATELMTRAPAARLNESAQRRSALVEAGRRNAEVLVAMGMAGRVTAKWQSANRDYLGFTRRVSNVSATTGVLSRTIRQMLQSGILGVGAWLVINGEATAGIIIAGSILFTRALAPVDAAIASAKAMVTGRQSWKRLNALLAAMPEDNDVLPLPDPVSKVSVNGISIVAPGTQKLLVQNVSFVVEAGKALGIVGPSGSGKSCLVRALAGAWLTAKGNIQLDGAALDQWSEEALGRHIGYMPQDVEMFAGTVSDNIARFDPEADPDLIVDAAMAAGVHDLITSLPQGYKTEIGEEGGWLSAGQRQRIALARALFGNPFFIILDEPNSNLDPDGEKALVLAIERVKARGGIVVVVAHRMDVLSAVDEIIIMRSGWASQPVPRDDFGKPEPLKPFPEKSSGTRQTLLVTPELARVLKQASANKARANGASGPPNAPGREAADSIKAQTHGVRSTTHTGE